MDERPRRGRGRPKGTGKVDPDDIIDAALAALTSGGYRGLSMRGIARTLGVSLSSVQNHYPTKDDLWRACVDYLTNDAMSRGRHDGPPDLARSISAFLELHGSRPGLLAALLTDADDGSTERIAYVAENFAKMLAGPAEELRELEAMGLARPVSADAFFALMTIGIGSIAGAAHALKPSTASTSPPIKGASTWPPTSLTSSRSACSNGERRRRQHMDQAPLPRGASERRTGNPTNSHPSGPKREATPTHSNGVGPGECSASCHS